MISTKENNLSVPVIAEVENTTQWGRSDRKSQLSGEAREITPMGQVSPSLGAQSFSSLNKNDRFTNGTGATLEKLGNHTARIVKYPGKPWTVGTFYTFGAFNYVEKV